MNCDLVHTVLPLYLSGELRGGNMAEMQLHLQECAQCARAVQADSELDSALRTAVLEQSPDVSAVLNRVYEGMTAPRWKWMTQLVPMRMAAVVAVLVVALIALPWLYVQQARRNIALAAAGDHYRDVVVPKRTDWAYKPEDVARFLQRRFPQKQNLLPSITPEGASLEKVRLCVLRGTPYAHFVFKTGTVETSVYLETNSGGPSSYQAVDLRDSELGLDVAGFSSAGVTGMVVGQHGLVSTLAIADRLSKAL